MRTSESGPARLAGRQVEEPLVRRALPIYYALLLAIATVFGIELLVHLRHVLLILFVSFLLASATSGPAAFLQQRRVPLGLAVLLIYLAVLAVIVAAGWFILPPLFGQVAQLIQDLPLYVERYRKVQQTFNDLRQQYPDLAPMQAQLGSAGGRVVAAITRTLANLPGVAFGIFLDLLSILVISALLVTSRRRLLDLILVLVGPRYREPTHRVLSRSWHQVGYYVRAKLIEMVIIGSITYGVLVLIGLPFAVPLAVLVALGEAVPRIGPWLARIPLLAVALLQGLAIFGLVFLASVIIENLKGFLIAPLVEGNQLDIPPLLIFVAVLIGSGLLGVGGAFIAVPVAAMVQILFEEVILPWRTGESADASERHGTIPSREES